MAESISQACNKSAQLGVSKKWSILIPLLRCQLPA
jgi:hypothetical protein